MIRIITTDEADGIRMIIDGQLAGHSVDAVESCSREAMAQGRPLHLFLREVSNIDEGGRMLLCRLAAKGVALSASGVYSSYIVEQTLRGPATAHNITAARLAPNSRSVYLSGRVTECRPAKTHRR